MRRSTRSSSPLRGGITLFDAAFLVSLFLVYVYLASRGEIEEESSLVGPAETIANLPTAQRRSVVVAMFLYAGAAILLAAEPFADGLIETGVELGIDEFQLVQWVAPLASEFPEFLVAGLLAWRLRADAALGALVSSKVNQWTLLIGCLPIAYAISSGTINPCRRIRARPRRCCSRQRRACSPWCCSSTCGCRSGRRALWACCSSPSSLTPHSIVPRNVFSIMYFVAAGIFAVRQVIQMRPYVRGSRAERPIEAAPSVRPPPS